MSNNPRFLLDEPLVQPGEYALGRQESHHAVNVLRLKDGEAVIVFDGLGNYADGLIVDADKNTVRIKVDGVLAENHLPLRLTLATAIPKGKRWQVLVEKCTELGVDRILPMLTERSVVKGEGDAEKWRRWVIEAAKQSRRARLPEITEPMRLPDVFALAKQDRALFLLADPQGESPGTYRDMLNHACEVVVMVGPEGGFSKRETEECLEHGARTIRLSPFTLRVETAAATVCAIIREVLL